MSYIKPIKDVPFHALIKAAQFLREKYNTGPSTVISDKFENEFGIKIHYTNDILTFEDEIEFSSEADYTMFLLRWS